MKKKIIFFTRIILSLLITGIAIFIFRKDFFYDVTDEWPFKGAGTYESPYLITSDVDLADLAMYVNEGESFSGCYFEQTCNIDLSNYENWTPIGIVGNEHYFEGVYDGAGHYIENININEKEQSVGLFGVLNGTVCNLGIESGQIIGTCVGSITSHGNGMIVNCWNKATIIGARAGGICDNFGLGKVICCWNEGEVQGEQTGNICSYSCGEIYGCTSCAGTLVNEMFAGRLINSMSDNNNEMDNYREYTNAYIRKAQMKYDLQYLHL